MRMLAHGFAILLNPDMAGLFSMSTEPIPDVLQENALSRAPIQNTRFLPVDRDEAVRWQSDPARVIGSLCSFLDLTCRQAERWLPSQAGHANIRCCGGTCGGTGTYRVRTYERGAFDRLRFPPTSVASFCWACVHIHGVSVGAKGHGHNYWRLISKRMVLQGIVELRAR
jgi:hypothetical protein